MNESIRHDLENLSGHVCVFGSMNADYTVTTQSLPLPGETVRGGSLNLLPGGKSGNQAAAAAKLGVACHMFGAVGSDGNADFLLSQLDSVGVDTKDVMRCDGSSGATLITVDAKGENTIVYSPGSNAMLSPEYVRSCKNGLQSGDVLGLCLETPIDTTTEAARICHEKGMCVVLNDSPFVKDLPADLLSNVDILLLNEVEVQQLIGESCPSLPWDDNDLGTIQGILRSVGFSRVVITLGAQGSVVLEAEESISMTRVCPVRVSAVDTTGCGDAFMGCLLAGLASGYSLVRCAELASYVGGYAACGSGAQASYGTVMQIEERFSQL